MKQNKRNIIITGIIITFLILLILIISINKESIKILGDRIRQQLNASSGNTVVDYEIINYDGENIELLFIARNENGIEKIVLSDMELIGKNRTVIGYDRTLKEGEVYQLKTKSEEDNKEELHTFLVTMKPKISISNKDVLGDGTTEIAKIEYPDNDNITKYYSLDNGETWQVYTGEIDVPKGETENILAKIEWNEGKTINKPMRYTEMIDVDRDEQNALRTITIKYNENYTNGTTKYYRIGETREWQEYTGPIILNDSDIDLNDIKKGTNKLAIYAKQMLGEGTVSISECEEEITTTVKLDVFNDMILTGKTLAEYGIAASWSGSTINAFSIGNFQAGNASGSKNWAGNFIWSNPKIYGATQLYVDFYQWSQAQGSAVSNSKTQINVSYNDGITSNKSNSILYGTVFNNVPWVHLPLTIELTSDDINYIQFYLNRI